MFLLNARLYQLPARLMIKINSRSQIQCSSLHPSVLATSVQAFLLSWWIFWIPWWHPSRSPNLCGAYQEPDIGAAHTHKALQLPVSKKGRGKSLSIRKKHKKRIKKIESTTFYVFSTYSKFFWTLPQFFFYCSSTTLLLLFTSPGVPQVTTKCHAKISCVNSHKNGWLDHNTKFTWKI